jgi:hypothetical protein
MVRVVCLVTPVSLPNVHHHGNDPSTVIVGVVPGYAFGGIDRCLGRPSLLVRAKFRLQFLFFYLKSSVLLSPVICFYHAVITSVVCFPTIA